MVAVLTGWHCVRAWGRLTAVVFSAPPPFCRPAAFASVALALADVLPFDASFFFVGEELFYAQLAYAVDTGSWQATFIWYVP